MTEQTAEFIFGSWSAPEIPVAVEYPLEVMDEIRAAATDGLQKLARGGLEVAGVLFGVQRDSGIRILTWRPVPCEYALGPTLQLSERDRGDLRRLIDSAAVDPDLEGLKAVGWFLSHTRSDVFLSPSDLEIFNEFFPEPWQATLVVRPSQTGVALAGFFVREADGALKSDSSRHTFEVKPLHRPARVIDGPVPVAKERSNSRLKPEPLPLTRTISAIETTGPIPADPPLFRTLERTRTPRGWLWMLPLVLGLIVAGFLIKERYLAKQNQVFSFHVYDAGGGVRIEWDQNAPAVRNAHLAAIDIKDGGETKRYPLADEELHSGKMAYARHGGDLEIRMTVYPVGFTPVQEFAHFLDPGPAAPPPATAPSPEIEELRKQRDQLQNEVKQLKDDLRKERGGRRRFR